MAFTYLGDYEQARKLLKLALESTIKSFGKEHPSTATIQSNLASVYQALGDYEQARDLLLLALESNINTFGEDHPSTATRRSNLAVVFQNLGDYKQARDLLILALESDIITYGKKPSFYCKQSFQSCSGISTPWGLCAGTGFTNTGVRI